MDRLLPAAEPDTRSAILSHAIPLFARAGFTGVSMRDIARTVAITPAALYHHFPDKQALYLAAMRQAFADKAGPTAGALASAGSAQERLQRYVERLCQRMHQDSDFRRLLQRERLDGNEERLQILSDEVFREQFTALAELASALSADFDPHLLAFSIVGLVMYHYETRSIRRVMPGYRPDHDDPDAIARHITQLILHGTEHAQ